MAASSLPLAASHNRAVPSREAVNTNAPLPEKTALVTTFVCPGRTATTIPVATSQICIIPLLEPMSTRPVGGESNSCYGTVGVTQHGQRLAAERLHSRAGPSAGAVSTRIPSGENIALFTALRAP